MLAAAHARHAQLTVLTARQFLHQRQVALTAMFCASGTASLLAAPVVAVGTGARRGRLGIHSTWWQAGNSFSSSPSQTEVRESFHRDARQKNRGT